MFDWVLDPGIWASLVTLTAMEIVLGIDNIVFISVIVGRLLGAEADRARAIGLALALVFRIIMLVTLFWLIHLTRPLFTLYGEDFSLRDLVLLAGGLFLLVKATREIHHDVEARGEDEVGGRRCRHLRGDRRPDRGDRRGLLRRIRS